MFVQSCLLKPLDGSDELFLEAYWKLLHILLMYWVNHLLDILAPRCPKGD